MKILGAGFILAVMVYGQSRQAEVDKLIKVLQRADATLHDKARACQQLGEFGTSDAVPALAALLLDARLSAYARSGLEGIPDPSAEAALRSALASLKGNLLIGVVNSIGVLRDPQAVGALTRLVNDRQSGAAKEALLSLGRVSDEKAIRVLRRILTNGPDELRPHAAAGSLLAAEFQLAEDNAPLAVQLYEAVRNANVPVPYRVAATRGTIVASKDDGVRLLMRLLASDDRETRNVAVRTIREIPGEKLDTALVAALEKTKPEVQAQLISSLADRRFPPSLGAIRAKAATTESTEVRQAAWRALGKVGDGTDVARLIKALTGETSPEEALALTESLSATRTPETDALILRSLSTASNNRSRVALINVLDARPPLSAATSELLKHAGDADLNVSVAALRALRSLAGVTELPALIALTRTYHDGSQRAAIESVLYYASTRSSDSTQAGELLSAQLNQASVDLDKASWIRTLCSLGYAKALPAIVTNLGSTNSWLAKTTVDSLRNWPDPAPVDELLTLAENSSRPGAIAAAIQMTAAAADRRTVPTATLASWFKRASKNVVSTEDKHLLIASLGRWRTVESLRLLAPYLDDAQLKTVAANAIVQVAQPVATGPDYAVVKPLLHKLSDIRDPGLIEKISELSKTIAATESKTAKP